MIFFELFYTFFLIGLFTFGGGYAMIPLIESMVVSKGWITSNVLADFIAISECTPGPFAINIATFIGSDVAGIGGSICATIGVVLPSLIIIILVAMVLKKFLKNRFVRAGLDGVKPVAIALILSTVIVLFTKIIFFGGNSLMSEFTFDIRSLTLFVMLLGYVIIYKVVLKKSIHPISLIGISALFGLIIFI